MKKNILYLYALLAMFGVSLVATSCSDEDSVKDIELSQVLSATELKAVPNADVSITVSWRQMFNADAYELIVSQDPTFVDESQVVYTNTFSQEYTKGEYCEVKVPNLDPETTYYARVQALKEDGSIENSKYVYAEVTTVPEQILQPVAKTDLTANSVTIHWPENEFVKEIELIDANGDIINKFTPSDADIAAGEYTIDDLDAHTTYTVRLVSATDKTRGRRTFTTLLDLSGATVITPTDDWVSIIENATSGTFAFAPGEYVISPDKYTDKSSVKINGNVVLAAQDINDMPTLKCVFQVFNNASPYFYYLKISSDEGKYDAHFVDFKSTEATGSLDVEGCELYDFTKGIVSITTSTIVNEINIIDCYIHDVVCVNGDFLDARSGGWTTLNFKNNTVVNCFANRAFVRDELRTPISNIVNNTFYMCGKDDAADQYPLFSYKIAGSVGNFENNIVEGYAQKRGFNGGRSNGTVTASNNVYFNCLNLTAVDENNTSGNKPTFLDESGLVLTATPFKDAKNGDFRLVDPNLRLKQVGASFWYEQDIEE